MAPIDQLKELFLVHNRKRFPNLPESSRIPPKYNDSTVPGLTSMVFQWLIFHDHPAEKRTIGDLKFMMLGSQYVTTSIRERYVVIEIRAAQDPLNEVQKALQRKVESAEGTYFLARTFNQFVFWYENFIA